MIDERRLYILQHQHHYLIIDEFYIFENIEHLMEGILMVEYNLFDYSIEYYQWMKSTLSISKEKRNSVEQVILDWWMDWFVTLKTGKVDYLI